MRKQKKYLFELIVILTVMLCFAAPVHSIDDGRELVADTTAPVISVWYGERQVFGKLGNPQKWINIMGSVSDIESEIELLTYTLNGEPGPVVLGIPGKLMVGPFPVKSDPRRLYFKGDFDIDIDKDDLKDGLNKVLITAKNKAGLESTREVIVEYQSGNTWELPYSIDWNTVDNATDVVQFVDGLWRWDKSGIRTARPAYDRLIAIGDMNWDNYEVTASVTVHYVDENGFRSPVSNQAGIGFLMRWQGHCDRPDLSIPCYQPKCGWLDLGAITWYFFRINRADYLSIWMEG
ncbi:hypothetical protein KAS50_03140, partial [bacterium]|nr:hypothetical protein [bacterium]